MPVGNDLPEEILFVHEYLRREEPGYREYSADLEEPLQAIRVRQEGILHLPCLVEEGLKRRALRREGPQGRGLNSRLQVRFMRLPGFDEGD